ncbi:MAG: YtxH domain-containing protein [Bacilli bacterium]|nr:YtxH domain-containing protein [Bacilli bacterium]
MNKKDNKNIKWYDSGNTITSLIIVTILIIIVSSQSFSVRADSSLALFSSIINHNSIYLLVLIYFIFLKFHFGKKYFNYLNVVLMFIYFLATITSLLTLVQAFSLNTVLSFAINFLIIIYLIHTLFRDTIIWKDFHLYNSPFNEITNDGFFYAILVVSVFLLAINLISTVAFSGVLISVLDCLYFILFGRYIYLYREFLDLKKLDSDNSGNFDEIAKKIDDTIEDVTEKINKVIEDSNVDEIINDVKEKVDDIKEDAKEKIDDVKADVKDKIDEINSDDKSKKTKSKKSTKKGDK